MKKHNEPQGIPRIGSSAVLGVIVAMLVAAIADTMTTSGGVFINMMLRLELHAIPWMAALKCFSIMYLPILMVIAFLGHLSGHSK